MFGIGDSKHFKCRVVIDTAEYYNAWLIYCNITRERDVFSHVTSLILGK